MMKEDYIKLVSRRKFLQLTSLTISTGFILGVTGCTSEKIPLINKFKSKGEKFNFDLFLTISDRGDITIHCHRSEMGNGVRTSIPMLIAEELGVPLEAVKVNQTVGHEKYGDQNTDGSRSITYNWDRLRMVGAQARAMLLEAAASREKLKPQDLDLVGKDIILKKDKKEVGPFNHFVKAASQVKLKSPVSLKETKDFKLIRKNDLKLIDGPLFVTGAANYGIDAEMPGMLYASIKKSPLIEGRILTFEDKEARKVPGVEEVFSIEGKGAPFNFNSGVAVLGRHSWAVLKAREKITFKYEKPAQLQVSQKDYEGKLKAALKNSSVEIVNTGSSKGKKGAKLYKQTYQTSFLAHAPMEPLSALVSVTGKGCEIWAPHQDPQTLRKLVSQLLSLPLEKVTVHVTFLGGGFGRKSQSDFCLEAATLSDRVRKPIKILWTREDEIQHGFYHAPSLQEISATVYQTAESTSKHPKRKLGKWKHKTVFPTIMSTFKAGADLPADWELGMGASFSPYEIDQFQVYTEKMDSPVRIGWMRAVCNVWHAFALNCFLDELAHGEKVDSIAFRLSLMERKKVIEKVNRGPLEVARLMHTIEKCRDMSRWDDKIKDGKALGFATHFNFGSYITCIMELIKDSNGEPQAKKAYVVIDCGHYVNPDTIRAQMEGGVIFGISQAMHAHITLKDGQVEQSNFDDYPVVMMNQSPEVEVAIVENEHRPQGVGEPAVPVAVAAFCNAYFKLTGKRARSLPIHKG